MLQHPSHHSSPMGLGSRAPNHQTQGFSLIEVVVAAGLLIIVAVGSALLFVLSNRQTVSTRDREEQQSAISDDVAAIQRLNDRYSCTAGANSCAVASYDPNEDQYYPSGSSNNTTFNDLCKNGGLITNLLTTINNTARPTSFTRLGITRNSATAVSDPSGEPMTHRYTVTWVNSNAQQLRQVTLVPTVANWCP